VAGIALTHESCRWPPWFADCHHAGMADDIQFFLAASDEAAAAARLRGPGAAFRTVSCRFIEPDTAIAEWDMYFEEPSAEAPSSKQLSLFQPAASRAAVTARAVPDGS
jgi:hypothetical protein